jgi:rare lipoprotein A
VALASWYGDESGGRTASGAPFNPAGLTFAHRSMAFGTRVRFCHGGRCVVATCTDRGPFAGGRSFDLSRGTFGAIAPLGSGVISVQWEVV